VDHEIPKPHPAAFSARNVGATVDAAEILAGLGSDSHVLVDARVPERFRGEVEPLDPVAGHIPGAINRPYVDNVARDGTLKAPDALRKEFARLLGDTPLERVVHYCGSGVTACHNALAMEVAGLPGTRLYPGSWSEWVADASRPVEVTDAKGSR
jgi:thiosulfate/3-mercaptopyruvate sulfurtransferase